MRIINQSSGGGSPAGAITAPLYRVATTMSTTAIDVTKPALNRALSANEQNTFSATPTTDLQMTVDYTADSTDRTVTFAVAVYSYPSQQDISTSGIIVTAGTTLAILFRYILARARWECAGNPSGAVLSPPTVDGTCIGPQTASFNCGYTSSAVGDLVYLDSSATWQKCDANTLLLYNGLLGIAMQVKASGAALLVALPGSFVYATAFPTLTIGLPIYMSETAGAITQTAPVTTDSATRVLGHGVHADKVWFFPDNTYTTHT